MPVIQKNRNQTFTDGALVEEQIVDIDVTENVVELDLHAKARAALVANRTFLAVASPSNAQTLTQVRALTRQHNALIKLLIGGDLLRDETADT